MSREVFAINGRLYLIDDETGEVKTVVIQNDQIPPNDLKELVKILIKRANQNSAEKP